MWTFVNVFFHFTIGLALAIALNRTLKFRGIYRMLLLVPWAVPSFISAFAWRFMFNNPYGFLDRPAPEARRQTTHRPSSATRPGRSSR